LKNAKFLNLPPTSLFSDFGRPSSVICHLVFNRVIRVPAPPARAKKVLFMPKTALITGVTGQDGSYLADFLLEKGYERSTASSDAPVPSTRPGSTISTTTRQN
jgi:hypothetical protein